MIVPLAACAGLFVALAPLHPDWPGWPGDKVLQVSSPRPPTAREAALLDAAKAQLLAAVESRRAHPAPAVPHDIAETPGDATKPTGPVADTSPIRVFIHHAMGAADGARAARLGAFLQSRGFTVAEIRSVDFDIDASSVRYFFDRDRAESRHLIEAVKEFDTATAEPAPDRLADLTDSASKPRPGDVEIWLASRSTGWTRSAQAAPP